MTVLTVYASGYASDIGGDWTNPTNVYSDNTTYATRVGTTKNVVYGNIFSFDLSSLPDNATLNSVTLKAEWHNSTADTSGPVLSLGSKYNNTLDTPTTDTTGQTGDEVLSHTVTGRTVAQLKSTGGTGFWAVLRFSRTDNTAHTAYCDYVRIEIDYSVSYVLQITAGSFTWTRNDAILTYIRKLILQITAGNFSWTGNNAFELYNRLTKTTAGSFTWTGLDAILTRETPAMAYVLQTLLGEFAWTRNNARLLANRQVRTTTGPFAWTGNNARLYRVMTMLTSPGSFIWTRNNATELIARKLFSTAGSFSWTRNNGIVLVTRQMRTNSGTFTWTRNNAVELWKHLTKTTSGQFTWTGLDAILTRLIVGQYYLYTQPGTFTLAGSERLTYIRSLRTTTQSFVWTGNNAKEFYNRKVITTPGTFVLTGNDALLTWVQAIKLLTQTGQFDWTGLVANLLIGVAIEKWGIASVSDLARSIATGSDFSDGRTFDEDIMTASGGEYGE